MYSYTDYIYDPPLLGGTFTHTIGSGAYEGKERITYIIYSGNIEA